MQGKIINGFELKRLLGVGGMAEVWYAENSIHKSAAVKLLSAELAHNEQIVERFRNEAEIMVKLNHPNIRQVYGYDSIDGRPAIVMEYLDGADLKARMKQGQHFSDEQLRKWWDQLVDALNYTHKQGIVHRDIKPGNIFVDNADNIKLLDFGIAKVRESISSTQTGQRLGTLMYMSPEQVKDSKHIDYRTDIYSLAVTFVHLLTGKKPYDSNTTSDLEISEKIVYSPLDLSEVPLEWRPLLALYLGKDPKQRGALKRFTSEVMTGSEVSTADNDATVIQEGLSASAAANNVAEASPVSPQPVKTPPVEEPQPQNSALEPQNGKSGKKKVLWIGMGLALAAIVAAILLWPKSENASAGSAKSYDDDKEVVSVYDDDQTSSYDYDDEMVVEDPVAESPYGTVNGVFSVGPYTQVYFSNGNLQYQASSNTWRFAPNQWMTLGYANTNVSSTNYGWIDLFGWGTGYEPYKSSGNNNDYSYYYEWGNYYGGGWRTLTANEWDYLFNLRVDASSKHGAAIVHGVKGIVILPDYFIMPSGCTLSTVRREKDYSMNIYSDDEWRRMEDGGAVFLPTAGRRTGLEMFNYGNDGDYWSSTPSGNEKAYNIDFSDAKVLAKDTSPRKHGFAVRLIKETY